MNWHSRGKLRHSEAPAYGRRLPLGTEAIIVRKRLDRNAVRSGLAALSAQKMSRNPEAAEEGFRGTGSIGDAGQASN